jgi:capsular polysaccharide biosynthesis protein
MNKKIESILKANDFTLVNLVRLVKEKALVLVITVIAFAVFGVIYYITTPNSYSTNVVVLVETQNSANTVGLGSLAQAARLNMGVGTTEITSLDPSLYPVIIQSKPFLEDLINSNVSSEIYQDSISLYKYMVEVRPENEIYKFLRNPFYGFKESVTVEDTNRDTIGIREKYEPLEIFALSKISERIVTTSEGKLLIISTNMPEARMSFEFSKTVKNLLISYVTKYLQEKQLDHVEYLEIQYKRSEKGFKDTQFALTTFKERNQGLFLESMKAMEQNLNSEYSLKYELFRTIGQELEMAKIELNSQKPIFSEIDPPYISNRPDSPNLTLTLAFCIVLGFIFGLIVIFLLYAKQYYGLHQEKST